MTLVCVWPWMRRRELKGMSALGLAGGTDDSCNRSVTRGKRGGWHVQIPVQIAGLQQSRFSALHFPPGRLVILPSRPLDVQPASNTLPIESLTPTVPLGCHYVRAVSRHHPENVSNFKIDPDLSKLIARQISTRIGSNRSLSKSVGWPVSGDIRR